MSEQTPNPAPGDRLAQPAAVQTTGHAWDGDLQEFNNPLPRWWLWSFYGTVVFAIIYWIVYPSWPIGQGWTSGLATVSYTTAEGESRTLPWNTRSALLRDMHEGAPALRQRAYLEQVAAASYEEIRSDPEMLAFARSLGTSLFGDNCAACHGRGGQGVMGLYPNLADDDWLWGGTMEQIEATLRLGREGFMPAYRGVLDADQLEDVAAYVLSLSGEVEPDEQVARGEAIFQGYAGGCYQCHGRDGSGIQSLGAADLTDRIWTMVDVPGLPDTESRRQAVARFVGAGVQQGQRVMPGWQDRLSPTEIKMLAVHVHQLGGGH